MSGKTGVFFDVIHTFLLNDRAMINFNALLTENFAGHSLLFEPHPSWRHYSLDYAPLPIQ